MNHTTRASLPHVSRMYKKILHITMALNKYPRPKGGLASHICHENDDEDWEVEPCVEPVGCVRPLHGWFSCLGNSYNRAKLFKVTAKGEGMGHA